MKLLTCIHALVGGADLGDGDFAVLLLGPDVRSGLEGIVCHFTNHAVRVDCIVG